MPPPQPPPPLSKAVAQMLTQGALFRFIQSFVAGWPRFMLDFDHTIWMEGRSYLQPEFPQVERHLPHLAIVKNNKRVLTALYELRRTPQFTELSKMQFTELMHCAIWAKNLEMLTLVHKYGHLDVIRFLHAHRTEGCTTQAMRYAADGNFADVIKFLGTHRQEDCPADTLSHVGSAKALRAVCEYSTVGCLFQARNLVRNSSNRSHVEILSRYIDPDIASCSITQHVNDGRPRRYQKQKKQAG